MKKELVGIFVCMLLIVTVLPASGTLDDNKILGQVSSDYDSLLQKFIDAGGCRVDWSEEAKLTASDGEPNDMFGRSISISGDYAIVGAPFADTFFGSSYVFKRTDSGWTEEQKLIASDGEPGSAFGWSVSMSGEYAIIGASTDDSTGSAYVFKRNDGVWTEEAKLTASDGGPDDVFGWGVSISGEYAIIGAPWDDSYTGSSYVFKRNDGVWTEEAKLTASDGEPYDAFGNSVSISGDYAIIGISSEYKTGSAYVFKRNDGVWSEEQKLIASDGEPGDYFSCSISISGDYAIIGAYADNSLTGSSYVFKRNDGVWTEETKLTASDGEPGDYFSYSVSISGDYAIIGAPGDYITGSSYVFKHTDSGWTEEQKLIASDGEPDDYFSYSVSMSGEYAIIGAYADDSFTGSVYLFKRPNLPPEKPIVSGPVDVEPGIENEYSFVAIDPEDEDMYYWIDWGDSTQGWLGPYPSGETQYINHAWTEAGVYEVKAKVMDENYQESEWSETIVISVGNLAPNNPIIDGPKTALINSNVEITFTATDPNNDDLYYYIDWGDGNTEEWNGPYGSGTELKLTHSWDEEKSFGIKAKVKDIEDEESGWTTHVITIPRNRVTFGLSWLRFLDIFHILQRILNCIS